MNEWRSSWCAGVPGSARVGVIVPVVNAMPCLQQLLDSLAGPAAQAGLDAARADDVLAPHALRSMLDYASDMVLPRIAGINGRAASRTRRCAKSSAPWPRRS